MAMNATGATYDKIFATVTFMLRIMRAKRSNDWAAGPALTASLEATCSHGVV